MIGKKLYEKTQVVLVEENCSNAQAYLTKVNHNKLEADQLLSHWQYKGLSISLVNGCAPKYG